MHRAPLKFLLPILLGCWITACGHMAEAQDAKPAADKPKVKPIRALLITGGCCHDYTKQKKILTEGISSRAYVEWEIVHEGGTATNSKIPYYENPDWAKGFDIVVHNECFSDIPDPKWTERVLKPHREGIPAIVIHCAMHCYRDKTDEWFKFLGVTSHRHGAHYAFEVVNIQPKHPIMQGFGNVWQTQKGELYQIAKLWDTATPLAYAMSRETMKQEPCIWVNQYGQTRVFGTTVGHYNEEMSDPVFLNYVTNGLLWATDKLQPEYRQPFLKSKTITVPENIALKKAATASASQEGHEPAHGNDGNEDTRWCAPNAGGGYSWQVDLGKGEEVAGARILWESDGKHYKYKLEGSADGEKWSTLSDQSAGIVDTQEHILKFEAKDVRHVRLTFLGADAGAWGSFWELEVHGTNTVEKTINSAALNKPKPVGGTGILRDIKVPADFEATVFAAPPQVTYPTCLATDLNGRVFVGIDENGSLDVKAGRGRIVRCIDSDSDGKADDFKTFARLDSPRGIVVDGNTLYVQHPPFVSALHDNDGDGVADRTQELVKGLGFDLKFRGADHTTNGMHLGIDGWLYIAVGDYGFVKAEGSDGKTVQLRGGGIVRVRPDGSELEIVSRGQRNIYDVAIDPFLNLFTRDNTNDGGGWNVRLSHVIPNAHMGYPSLFVNFPEEIVQPLADYGGGSPCGSLFIDDAGLPGDFAHSLYTCDWGRSIVYRHPLQKKGAGFEAEQEAFVEIPRPTDMDIDGRSQIFISSWKDGGFNYSRPDVGYVIRVTPRSGIAPEIPDLAKATDDALVAHLKSDNHVRRLHAQRELLRRTDRPEIVSKLEAIIRSDASLAVRVAVLFTLKELRGIKSHDFLLSLLQTPELEEFALRALADRKSQNTDVPADPFVAALKSPNARVRLQAVLGLTRLGRISDVAAIVPLTVDADPLVAHVAIRGLIDLEASEACLAALDSPTHASGCLRVLRELHQPAVVQGLLKRLEDARDLKLQAEILTALCRLCFREDQWKGDWWTTRPDTSGPYYNPVKWDHTETILKTLQHKLENSNSQVQEQLMLQLGRHKIDFPAVQPILLIAMAAGGDFREQAIQLLAGRKDLSDYAAQKLSEVVGSQRENGVLRATAARGLARNLHSDRVFPITTRTFGRMLQDGDLPAELHKVEEEFLHDPAHGQSAAGFAKLTTRQDPVLQRLGYAVLMIITERSAGPNEARDLAQRTIDAGWKEEPRLLLQATDKTQAETQAFHVREYLNSDNPELREAALQAAKRLELDQPADPNQPLIAGLKYEDVVADIKAARGDPKQGVRFFARQGCVACHTVSPGETLKGPLLAGISTRYKREELLESILKPSQKLAQGFESQFFVMTDGRVHEGFVVREAADEIDLRTNNGTPMTLKKRDVEERGKRTVSMMPEKLVDQLNVNQLASLLAYLESLKAN